MSSPSPQAGHLNSLSDNGVWYPQSRQMSSVAHDLVGPAGTSRCGSTASLMSPPVVHRFEFVLVLWIHLPAMGVLLNALCVKNPDQGAESPVRKVANPVG